MRGSGPGPALAGLLLVLAVFPARGGAPRAAGGMHLLEAMESAPATVVAQFGEPARAGQSAYSARIRVERSLHGPLEAGDEARIAWEELASARAPRFAAGERVLLCLQPLPGASIWRERFPDVAERKGLLSVAARGKAFLRRPSLGTLGVLEHYLALPRELREGPGGAVYLVDLAADAELPLAKSALERLGGLPALDEALAEGPGERLAGAFLRADADDAFRDALAELVGRRRLDSTRPGLEVLAASDPPPPAQVFEALAALEGGVAGPRLEVLLEDAPAAQRRVAARHASGPEAADTLAGLLRADPAPEVRVAAVERLAELEGEGALEPLLGGLADPEGAVRGAAARRLAGLGAAAVPRLQQVVDGNDPEAASAAVVALGLCPAPQARQALLAISSSHPDPALRALAELALGGPLVREH
jgi:hypothetical protein